MRTKQKSAFSDRKMLGRAIKDSFAKLSPKTQAKNPVMFLVFVSAILTSILWVVSLFGLCRILTRKRLFEFLTQTRDKKEQVLHL